MRTFLIADYLSDPDIRSLVAYIKDNPDYRPYLAIIDWCAYQPELMAKLKDSGLLLTYFAHAVEHVLTQSKLI